MEALVMGLLEEAKKNKKVLRSMKDLAVKAQQFELASQLRDIEVANFPESEEEKMGRNFQTALAMVDIKCDEDLAYKIYVTTKEFLEKGGEFSLKDAANIKVNVELAFKP